MVQSAPKGEDPRFDPTGSLCENFIKMGQPNLSGDLRKICKKKKKKNRPKVSTHKFVFLYLRIGSVDFDKIWSAPYLVDAYCVYKFSACSASPGVHNKNSLFSSGVRGLGISIIRKLLSQLPRYIYIQVGKMLFEQTRLIGGCMGAPIALKRLGTRV